ncbi:MAG: hypothetical protein J6T39_02245, partial [Clostridia bacterium]|nr:hypothetical protein [Clostridia bacterium]
LISDFFKEYFPKKSIEAISILEKTNPYFFDKDEKCHIDFFRVLPDNKSTSSVGHHGNDDFLTFTAYLHGTLSDMRIITHEITHGISSHHKKMIDLIDLGNQKAVRDYQRTMSSFKHDCVGEIESHITERLFNYFLYKKKLLSKDDLINYDNLQRSSLAYEINTIKEECEVLKNLDCPVTFESLKKFVSNMEEQENFRLVDRTKKMMDKNQNASYMFRYVVGRIVAYEWFKEFKSTTTNDERCEMLAKFENFLDNTDSLTLDDACKFLLGKSFEKVANDFTHDIKRQKSINEIEENRQEGNYGF